jgi:guanosine-3',5'-bis(diphosphate) 3'-pyrophosphohydrolase
MLTVALPRLGYNAVDDALAAVGRGELPSRSVIEAVFPDYQDERASKNGDEEKSGVQGEGWFDLKQASAMKFRVPGSKGDNETDGQSKAIPIRSQKGDLPVSFAPEGGAVPGDRIVGIHTPGQGITIYPIHSPALQQFDDQPELWLDVRWDIDEASHERFPARLHVSVINEPGGLAAIAQVIADNDGNIDNIHMNKQSQDFQDMTIDLEVWTLSHLNRIIEQIRSKQSVSKIERIN